ncbi:phosphopeptide-binding protein [Bifidobacterium myosotis]|uniref:Phosphopeptide-binding protein n=1 Tax=Bifidobacterium myosotis TaxID=1630166 RepID=A0A261FQD8_9BIFI|nr:FHA domain-containing protein [Bifidobacterium myosotis]OZG61402.1 phosphopeptide-binding protein [Bifidobacterium myosotis]
MSEWTVRINGVDQASVKPGECVEIGRKPLRPLADDGNTRVDIVDQTKSMSKRHAVFGVKDNGSGYVRDLGSTNGSYVVRDNGDLLRLPQDVDFLLPTSPMRMQFGDVPADFIRIEEPDDTDEHPQVQNLFGYAVGAAPQEPDAADMSVDDILDLRAGEPTAMFSADMVKRKVRADALALDSLAIPQLATKQEPAKPRDLFADALSQQSDPQSDEQPAQSALSDDSGVSGASGAAGRSGITPDGSGANQAHDERTRVVPQTSHGSGRPATSGLVPVDAIAHAVVRTSAAASSAATALAAAAVTRSDDVADGSSNGAASDNRQAGGAPTEERKSAESTASSAASAVSASSPIVAAASPSPQDDLSPSQPAGAQTGGVTAAGGQDDPDATGVYTPAFEPGSVFDRVAKGELKAQEPVIEVDGLTSDDAKRTQDFALQFEIARHPQLLAFLAMNPYLYDDMYAWLAARGEADIDEALAHNEGYQEYRKAVGK